jgi:hypothetical protein
MGTPIDTLLDMNVLRAARGPVLVYPERRN